MTPLAQCVSVTRAFGQAVAVDHVDLAVGPGEVVGLLGANGAGKTTLIRMLLGLLRASAGQVRLFGQPPSRQTRRRIGYVPQDLGLYDDLTVAENLAFAREVFGGDGADRYGLPAALRPFAQVTVGALPLGVARRAAFTQALAHHPDLLILDEPTSGVDPLARARLWETIQDAAEAGAGVIVTTHYMEEAEECTRLVVMAAGRVVAEGTAAGIVGERRTVVVDAGDWAAAVGLIEAAGLRAILSGTSLRVPGAAPATVRRILADGALAARVHEEPVTLEERFFELAQAGRAVPAAGRAARPAGRTGAARRRDRPRPQRAAVRRQRHPGGHPGCGPAPVRRARIRRGDDPRDRRRRRRGPRARAPFLRHQGAAVRRGHATAGGAERGAGVRGRRRARPAR